MLSFTEKSFLVIKLVHRLLSSMVSLIGEGIIGPEALSKHRDGAWVVLHCGKELYAGKDKGCLLWQAHKA